MLFFVNLCLADSLFTLPHFQVVVNKFFCFFIFSFIIKNKKSAFFKADLTISLNVYYVKGVFAIFLILSYPIKNTHKEVYKDIIFVQQTQKGIPFDQSQPLFPYLCTAQNCQRQKSYPDKKHPFHQPHKPSCQFVSAFQQGKPRKEIQHPGSQP